MIAGAIFYASFIYAVLGNAIVFALLQRRNIRLSFFRSGNPLYLYRVCRDVDPPVPRALTRFALSVNIALLLAIPSGIWFAAT
jgi:hypothetical protein